MIDSVSNDFHSEDRCQCAGGTLFLHCTSTPFSCSHHLRQAIAFKREPSEQSATVTFGGVLEAI
jgi:hypothetical protein